MALNVGKEIAALKRMTVTGLRGKYAEVTGEETRCRHKEFLVRRIAWRLQVNKEGDLSERAKAWAKELAADSDVRLTAPKKKVSHANGHTKVSAIQISQDDRLPLTTDNRRLATSPRQLPPGNRWQIIPPSFRILPIP